MKNASVKMFRYGKLVNLIYGLVAIGLIGLATVLIIVFAIASNDTKPFVDLLTSSITWLVFNILAYIFVTIKLTREYENGPANHLTLFILAIVFGALSGNPFFVLTGIFGIIAENQNKEGSSENAEQANENENKGE